MHDLLAVKGHIPLCINLVVKSLVFSFLIEHLSQVEVAALQVVRFPSSVSKRRVEGWFFAGGWLEGQITMSQLCCVYLLRKLFNLAVNVEKWVIVVVGRGAAAGHFPSRVIDDART